MRRRARWAIGIIAFRRAGTAHFGTSPSRYGPLSAASSSAKRRGVADVRFEPTLAVRRAVTTESGRGTLPRHSANISM